MFFPAPLPSVKFACAAARDSTLEVADRCPGQTSPFLPEVVTDLGWIHGAPRSREVTSAFFNSAASKTFGVAAGVGLDAGDCACAVVEAADGPVDSVVEFAPHPAIATQSAMSRQPAGDFPTCTPSNLNADLFTPVSVMSVTGRA
jgi:hypothetical protein